MGNTRVKIEQRLEGEIRESFKDNTINLNGQHYISLDLFVSSVRETMINDILLGAIVKKLGSVSITDEEILMYISQDYDKTMVIYDNNQYQIVSNSVE